MGPATGSWPARRDALRVNHSEGLRPRSVRVSTDLVVLLGVAALLMLAGSMRREFLGDGVRHLHAILSDRIQPGEPRWLLFPPLAGVWVRLLSAVGMPAGPESTLRALVMLSVASGILFLVCVRAWLRCESTDDVRVAAALLLAGCCAPVLILFSDIAEPQIAAALAAAGLAYARVWRDHQQRAPAAALCAVGAISVASLIYQGMILALGMLPLVVSTRTVSRRRVLFATGAAVLLVVTMMIVAQAWTGTSVLEAASGVFHGERNPLMRSMMASQSAAKYVAAVFAGPPQGIVALVSYSGVHALAFAVASGDQSAIADVILWLIGFAITAALVVRGVRDRQWRVLAAAAIILALPVIRNQQYAYVKFYILWPIPVALLAIGCRTRMIFVAAIIVLAANTWVVSEQIRHGRDRYRDARLTYASATASTCWLTSGWTPPFAYLWPGSATPILGTLATGTDPEVQRTALTASLRRCFCQSDKVWTDTTSRDADVVSSVARHFEYRDIDLPSVLIDPHEATGNFVPSVWRYSESTRQRACRTVSR
jgi:hypothetical protein